MAALASTVRIPSHQLHWLPLRLQICLLSPCHLSSVSATTDTPARLARPTPRPHRAYHLSRLPLLRPKGGPIKSKESKGKRATHSLPPRRISHKDTPSLISLIPCPKPPTPPHCSPARTRNFEAPPRRRHPPVLQSVVPREDFSSQCALHLPSQKARAAAGEKQVATV